MTGVDLPLLATELAAAGVPATYGLAADDGTKETTRTFDAEMRPSPLSPAQQTVLSAHDASKPQRAAAFEAAEDAERLRVINERARTDPAYAALAELALRGKSG